MSDLDTRAALITGRHLPIIITEPGTYRTRNGRQVLIQEVDGKGSCSCKGYLLKVSPTTGRTRRIWNIWRPNGRYVFLGEHPRDIIAKEG